MFTPTKVSGRKFGGKHDPQKGIARNMPSTKQWKTAFDVALWELGSHFRRYELKEDAIFVGYNYCCSHFVCAPGLAFEIAMGSAIK
jgi:hypothetical protein